ncbi:MAG: iron-containing redox enzyme family protein [Gammaproteobacteria bacterium]|nr:iron-containing redox enzyme family protein [Gammaproteobacteria bacterium]
MDQMAVIKAEFDRVLRAFERSPAMQRILTGKLTVDHYKSYLRQTYHYTKDNPQIQSLATVYFQGSDRKFVRMFYKHAISEIGHDELALNDLKTLGENIDRVRIENPLPATVALNAFVFYQIYNRNPIGYLGYLFFLEFLPTSSGAGYMNLLEKAGIPREAMTFLAEHTSVDVYHNRMMEKYVTGLVMTDFDLQAVLYTLRGTGKLYADMLQSAFEHADRPDDWGIDTLEAARYSSHQAGLQESAQDVA